MNGNGQGGAQVGTQLGTARIAGPLATESNLYAVLGVDQHADADGLAEAYTRLRERYHPNRNPDDPLAVEIVRYLDAAYAVLIDPDRRGLYDASLRNGALDGNGTHAWLNAHVSVSEAPDRQRNATVVDARSTEGRPASAAELLENVDMGRGRGGGGRRRSTYADRDFTTGSIPRNLWFLAWPQMIEGVLNVVDQMADLFWAGRGFGSRAIAGIGVAQTYTGMAMTGRMGIDTAMRAMVSRAVGAGDVALANHVALQAFTLSGAFSLLMVFVGVFLTEPLLRLLGVSDAVISQGAMYMRVQFIGQGTTAFRMMSGAALQASGDTLTPMKATAVTRVAHIALAPLLAFGWWFFPNFGLTGLAVANVLAQFLGVVMNFFALFRGTSRLHLTLKGYRMDLPLLWRIAKLGAPASVNSLERNLAQLVMVRLVAPFGDVALAAFSLTRRVEMFANLGSQGLGQASGIIVGQNLGAGRPERAKQTVLWATGYVMAVKSVFGAVIFAFPFFFLSIFNQEPELLSVATVWLRIQVAGYLAMGVGQVAMQSFQTAGDTLVPMIVTLFSMYGVEVPLALVLTSWTDLGQFGVAWAIVAAMLVRPLIYIPYFFWGPWTKKQVLGGPAGRMGARALH